MYGGQRVQMTSTTIYRKIVISYFYKSTLFAIWFLVGASVRLDFYLKKNKKQCEKAVQSTKHRWKSLVDKHVND